MQARKIPPAVMALVGIISFIFLFITGDNYSMTAYPILHLNLYYSGLVLMNAWIDRKLEREKWMFEAKLFLPIWLAIASSILMFGKSLAVLWILWMILPLVYIDGVLRFISSLAHDFNLRENLKRPVILMITPPLLLLSKYRTIYGLQALTLLTLYLLNFVLEFRTTETNSEYGTLHNGR